MVRVFKAAAALSAVVLTQIAAGQSPVALDHQHAAVRAVMALQADVTPGLMSTAVILGTAVGVESETPVLLVFVDRNNPGAASAIASLPAQMRGIGVRVEVSEKFRALAAPPKGGGSGGSGVDHRGIQSTPIQLGNATLRPAIVPYRS
jgi:hypothetical protein